MDRLVVEFRVEPAAKLVVSSLSFDQNSYSLC